MNNAGIIERKIMRTQPLMRQTRQAISTFITTLFLACMLVTSVFANAEPVTITFYHTSDIHEYSDGLTRIAKFVQDKQDEGGNILFVDTGDWFDTGDLTPLFTRGEAIMEMIGASNYDAVVPGNHDYRYGSERLSELADTYAIPILTANWPTQKYPRYRIHTFNGVKVGIIGTATLISNYVWDKDIKIENIADAVKAAVAELETQADIIVLLTHVGRSGDAGLAKAVPRLDLIFGGHDHAIVAKIEPNERTGTIILHSGSYGKFLGEVTITWDGEKIVDQNMQHIEMTKDMEQSEALTRIVNKYKTR